MSEQITRQLMTAKYSPKTIVEGYYDNETRVAPLEQPFLVPVYQRLYTWEHEHVERLMKDLWAAYNESPQNEYFIGAVVVSPDGQNLELIDGQQRMTTLWLIASVLLAKNTSLTEEDPKWHEFMAIGKGEAVTTRLIFSGRQADKEALERFVQNRETAGDKNSWIKNETMRTARKAITGFLNSELGSDTAKLHGFGRYIWEKATFVITHLHPDTEKERFFDTMNSSGVQLEKHEILKALLLHGIGETQRRAYAKVWDLCADIHGYIPGDVQTTLGYGLKPLNETDILNLYQQIAKISGSSHKASTEDNEQGEELTLQDIIARPAKTSSQGVVKVEKQAQYKSAVSFPVFLLHVLRIFKDDTAEEISLDDKKLIETFKVNFSPADDQHHVKPYNNKQQCMGFIECLLECRLLLDNFVIKGQRIEGSDHANWRIWSRLADAKRKERRERTGNQWASVIMLQSMMYFSRDLIHVPWLTPTLRSLRELCNNNGKDWDGKDEKGFLKKLKQQDNAYVQTRFAGKSLEEAVGAGGGDAPSGLGTATPHYWFYKLEYCLWEIWFNDYELPAQITCDNPEILKKSGKSSFRMRHVTSVEHVSPQNGENKTLTDDLLLHRFGNLALISVGANSSYSAKHPRSKAIDFKLKLEKGFIESLKLAHIFNLLGESSQVWGNDAMKQHENAMMSVLKAFHPS
jgi:hypothetical protein